MNPPPDRNKPTAYQERFGTRQPISFRLNDLNNNYYGGSGSNASPNTNASNANPFSSSPRSRDTSNLNPSTPGPGSRRVSTSPMPTPTGSSTGGPGSARSGNGARPRIGSNEFRNASREAEQRRNFESPRHTTRYTYMNPAPISFHRQMARKRYNDRRQQRVARNARVDSNANFNENPSIPEPSLVDSNANPFLFSMPREPTTEPQPERLTFQNYMNRSRTRSRSRDINNENQASNNLNSNANNNRTRPRSRSRSRSATRFLSSVPSFLYTHLPSSAKVLDTSGEKYLPRILRYLSWSELLAARLVSKKWLEVVSSSQSLQDKMGVITIRDGSWQEVLRLFNESPVIWDSFRILARIFIDMTDPLQLQFWMKHGPLMRHLEVRNNSMTISGLVEVLAKCPNLRKLSVSWGAELYPFNPEMIKKYYGVKFDNGTFSNMRELTIKRSCFLTDNALLNLLKWCGGNLRKLTLTYPPEEEQDPLSRLKPRWTVQPLKSYIERFGYMGNLTHLDFSWTNVSSSDLRVLTDLENLSNVKSLSLNNCKIRDEGVEYFLKKKGARLERLELEEVPVSGAIFGDEKRGTTVPKLKILNISGAAGAFNSLQFVDYLPSLKELKVSNTKWLEYTDLLATLKKKCNVMRGLAVSGGLKVHGSREIDQVMHRAWFAGLLDPLTSFTKLDLSYWDGFSKNENFRVICSTLKNLEELVLKGWTELSDAGVTGIPPERLHKLTGEKDLNEKEQKERIFVGSLTKLRLLDLSESGITDASIKYGVNFLQRLRKFAFDKTEISDKGIQSILQKNKSIDKVSWKGCQKITTKQGIRLQRTDGRFIHVGEIAK